MTPTEMTQVRQALGLTVKDFARGINIAPFSVERWEADANSPIGIQEMVYQALQTVIARVPRERQLAIGAEFRLGLGAMLVSLLLNDVRGYDGSGGIPFVTSALFGARETKPTKVRSNAKLKPRSTKATKKKNAP